MPNAERNGPAFGKAATHISDVQITHTVAPDGGSLSIVFDNLTLVLLPAAPPVATRTMSISYPLVDIKAATPITLSVRGHVTVMDGAAASLALRVLGETHALDPLLGGKTTSGDFVKTLNLTVRPGASLNMVLLLALDRNAASASAEALLAVDALDMALR